MSQVILKGIQKRFGQVEALKFLDLTVENGEFVSLLGPSGCGKTTTLRIIAGLETPTAGDVAFDGRRVTHLPPAERDIAMVFQLYALYPYLSAAQNIAFPLKARRLDSATIAKRVTDVARLLGIGSILNRYPKELHAADGQRVAIAKAIVRDPGVFLFDEPLSHLDPHARAVMRSELKHLHEEVGKTMLFVTHDQIEAMALSDRIAVMRKGELVQLGTPDEVFQKPVDRYVAEFIGVPPMNILPATPIEDGIGRGLLIGGQWFACAGEWGGADALNFGIRPRYVSLIPQSETPSDVEALRGTVELIEPMGRERQVHVAVGEELRIRSVVPYSQHFEVGQRVSVLPQRSKIRLFDATTGRALTP